MKLIKYVVSDGNTHANMTCHSKTGLISTKKIRVQFLENRYTLLSAHVNHILILPPPFTLYIPVPGATANHFIFLVHVLNTYLHLHIVPPVSYLMRKVYIYIFGQKYLVWHSYLNMSMECTVRVCTQKLTTGATGTRHVNFCANLE